jgi:hypothetical protein
MNILLYGKMFLSFDNSIDFSTLVQKFDSVQQNIIYKNTPLFSILNFKIKTTDKNII